METNGRNETEKVVEGHGGEYVQLELYGLDVVVGHFPRISHYQSLLQIGCNWVLLLIIIESI